MLTYKETIRLLGEQSFHNYMGGSHMPYNPVGAWIVSEIYGIPFDDVRKDIDAHRDDLIQDQIEKASKNRELT